jgi:hypothetical protein
MKYVQSYSSNESIYSLAIVVCCMHGNYMMNHKTIETELDRRMSSLNPL